MFAQFFEDHETPTNRTAWAPLNLARYLLEKREPLDPDWRNHCDALIDFVRRTFTHREFGVTVCHEQDEDKQAWGGVVSTYGAVLASYAKAVGAAALASEARQALNFALYCIDAQGRPARPVLEPAARRMAGGCAHGRDSQFRRRDRRLSGVGRVRIAAARSAARARPDL